MKKEWKRLRFRECVTMLSGGTPSKAIKSYWVGDIPWVSCKDMKTERIFDSLDHLNKDGVRNGTRLVAPGTVLMVVRGMILAKEFPVAIAMREVAFNQDLKALKCAPFLTDRFLFYWLKSMTYEILGLADEAAHGTKRLQTDRLENLKIDIPPKDIQGSIVSVLSAYDNLIEKNTRRIKILEEMAQMIYREWFANFRFPGHEKVKLVKTQSGTIPSGWDFLRVEDIVVRVPSGKKYEQKTVSPNGQVPVLDQGKTGIIGYHGDVPGVQSSFADPIITFANHTCYQRLVLFPFSAIQNVLPFRSDPKHKRDIYWLHWATKDLIQFNDYKGHWPEFINKQVLVPTPDTAAAFGGIVKHMAHACHVLEKTNQNLRQTRDLLLPRLICGEVGVEHLDEEAVSQVS